MTDFEGAVLLLLLGQGLQLLTRHIADRAQIRLLKEIRDALGTHKNAG